MRKVFVLAALSVLSFPAAARATSIVGSKHDLSAGSATTGPKAVSQSEVCIFCHTPHRGGLNVPLWNHALTTQTFTFYSSNYLNAYLGIAPPSMADLTGTRTKLCLSCHDGVTALGSLFNVGGAGGGVGMTGTLSATSNLGTDLRNDHPVLYDIKPGAGPPGAPGTDPEIRLPAGSDPVKVYGATNRVECTSCHNPHDNQFGSFLVKSNANAALCTACHLKSGFSASSHGASAAAYTPPGAAATTVSEWSCRSCHRAHGASSAQAYLLRGAEEATCYQCHGNPPLAGADNIQNQFAKTYKHPAATVTGVHLDPEQTGANFTASPNKRHSECQDCHNPHQAQNGNHTAPTNLISKPLLGQWGVEPTYGATAWVPATSFARQVFTTTTGFKEYQLCLKCHSSYAYSTTPPTGATDQSTELNVNNRSVHPVRAGANSQTGSAAPKALAAAQMKAPWTALGTQTMYCSDCHGSELSTDPKGPHGSAAARIKKGYWPKTSAGAYYTLGNNNANDTHLAGLLCRNCHPLRSATSNTWYNNVHREHSGPQLGNVACVACHTVIPHGARRGRLIGYASEAAPYNAGGTGAYEKLVLSGFKKTSSPTNYSKSNCYSTVSGCTDHSNAGGYDP